MSVFVCVRTLRVTWNFLCIQQVETVGDKYMAVSGLPDECENHAVSIARLALDMIEKADSVKMGNKPIVSRFLWNSNWI